MECVIKENIKYWIKFSVWANIRMEIAASSTGWRFTDYRLGKIVQVEDVSYSSQDLPEILCLSKISLWAKNISCSWSTLHTVMSDQTKICTLLNLCQYLTLKKIVHSKCNLATFNIHKDRLLSKEYSHHTPLFSLTSRRHTKLYLFIYLCKVVKWTSFVYSKCKCASIH